MLLNILIPLIGIVVDQIVKYWASTDLQAIGTIPLWEGVFHLTYCENTVRILSALNEDSAAQLTALADELAE